MFEDQCWRSVLRIADYIKCRATSLTCTIRLHIPGLLHFNESKGASKSSHKRSATKETLILCMFDGDYHLKSYSSTYSIRIGWYVAGGFVDGMHMYMNTHITMCVFLEHIVILSGPYWITVVFFRVFIQLSTTITGYRLTTTHSATYSSLDIR